MKIEIRETRPEDAGELGRICYDAFKDIADKHGFPSDFPSVEFTQGVLSVFIQREDFYGCAAFGDGAPRGSSFVNKLGDVAGIGPVSVDVSAQGEGIGRQLMMETVAHARGAGFEMVRLVQEAFNMQSLALYASLGFDTKEPLSAMALAANHNPDANVRPATPADYERMDQLCRDIYRVSRRGEYAAVGSMGIPIFVLDRGHVSGYLVLSAMGHGVAESEDDMLTLLHSAGALNPGAEAMVPLREGSLYRRALAAGHRNKKLLNLMALGPYEEPQGAWTASVMF
jgi:GNAT superfamily N-acetyltransferase